MYAIPKADHAAVGPDDASRARTRLVILDFDETLACCQVTAFRLASGNTVDNVFGGQARHASLGAFLVDVCARGGLLAIVSFNSRDVICRALAGAGWLDHFGPRVFGGDEVGRYRSSKPALIERELLFLLRLSPADAILVDDDEDNCRAVQLLGMHVVHVRDKRGMGDAEQARVLDWMAQDGRASGLQAANGGSAPKGQPSASDGGAHVGSAP
jgi:hypothetical protein